MNDFILLAIVGLFCVLIAYIVRTYNNVLLKNSLKKQMDEVNASIARAYKLLKSMGEQPEEMLTEGLAGAGIGDLLQNLDLSQIKDLIPAKYHLFLPAIQGFLDSIKKKGAGNVASEQPTFKGQTE